MNRTDIAQIREYRYDPRPLLAVCDEIITRSGGTLTIINAPGGGTAVAVRLPFAPESGKAHNTEVHS